LNPIVTQDALEKAFNPSHLYTVHSAVKAGAALVWPPNNSRISTRAFKAYRSLLEAMAK
jgi:hypothetical protein